MAGRVEQMQALVENWKDLIEDSDDPEITLENLVCLRDEMKRNPDMVMNALRWFIEGLADDLGLCPNCTSRLPKRESTNCQVCSWIA